MPVQGAGRQGRTRYFLHSAPSTSACLVSHITRQEWLIISPAADERPRRPREIVSWPQSHGESVSRLELRTSCVWLQAGSFLAGVKLPLTVAYQIPLSMAFSRQEYQSGLPFPSPGKLPKPGIKPKSLTKVFCIGKRVLYCCFTWEAPKIGDANTYSQHFKKSSKWKHISKNTCILPFIQ